jgi:hydroxyacylglutathione hydrolase
MITVTTIPILQDNYTYLVETSDGVTAIIDPGEAAPIMRTLELLDLKLDYILNTHHHGDHVAGNFALKDKYGAKILAPEKEKDRIKMVDVGLSEGSALKLGKEEVKIIETPGHTKGGICFFFKNSRALFTGDTLFSLGCGRLIEGTAEEMWGSLQKILMLPDTTNIYCGHEYTKNNGEFCLSVEPDNTDLQNRMTEVRNLRNSGQPTLPVRLDLEKKTNVFLRAGNAKRFAELRQMKDMF